MHIKEQVQTDPTPFAAEIGSPLQAGTKSQPEAGTAFQRLALDFVFTVLLIGLVVYGAMYVDPAISGKPHRLIGAILFPSMLPIVTLLVLSLVERLLHPAGPRKSARNWFLHLQINIFYFFMAGIAAVLMTMWFSALARHFGFHLGLIDLRFAHGKGLLFLLGAVWVAAVAGDFFFYWFHRILHETPFLWAHH